MKAVIPAAGLGTRFLPATKCSPKELLPVLDKPVIQYVVEESLEPEGVDGVVIVNSHEKPQIEQYFSVDEAFESMLAERGKAAEAARVHEASTLPVSFVYQDEARGLGHAVLQAAEKIDGEPFFVLLGDYFVPDRKMCVRMAEVSREHGGASVIAVAPVPPEQVSQMRETLCGLSPTRHWKMALCSESTGRREPGRTRGIMSSPPTTMDSLLA